MVKPVAQPDLPDDIAIFTKIDRDGTTESEQFTWPPQTRKWWAMWAESPLAADFTSTDWSELMDTAMLHAQFWSGDFKTAGELRLRVAKFGATPEDRARLRITFAVADEAEERAIRKKTAPTKKGSAKPVDPRAILTVVS